MAIVDYELEEVLATSSRSVVRRATRKSDDLSVIIKSPAQEPASSEDQWHLELEYRLLQKLSMSCVVRAIAFEHTAESTALVLEDFGGEPAGSAGGLPLEHFLPLALQAARGLGQIHDAGVVHKDIKPANLLVNRATGELKFIDFHLASELTHERQELTSPNQLQGTLAYMSPEQTGRMNRQLDYRSDYYSLGVTLFELLTGQLPFHAADAMGFVHAHLSKRPPLATQLRPELPAVVAEIVAKLLAKDPDDRYQSANGIVHDLEQCQQQWSTKRRIDPFVLAKSDVSERFALPQKLFGRDEEAGRLLAVFGEVRGGASRLALISGHSGVGKTSLVEVLQGHVTNADARFVSGKFDQLDRNVPYAGFVQALRGLVKQLLFETDARLAEVRRALHDALSPNAQIIIELVPELSQIMGPQPTPAELGPTETQHRFRRLFREFLRVFASPQHPLVIFLDDLQWLDASSPDLLGHLFGDDQVSHLLIVGAYRDNEVGDGHPLSACLGAFSAARSQVVCELRLGALSEGSVNELVAETLRMPTAETADVTQLLYERTAGNPLFVSELLLSLHRAGAFAFQRGQQRFTFDLERVSQAAVSDSVAGLMVERLSTLSAAARRALHAAACIGAEFELGLLVAVTGSPLTEVAGALWEGLSADIVVPLDANYRLLNAELRTDDSQVVGLRFRFQHARVQRAAYELADQDATIRLHAALGRRLIGRADAGGDVFEVVNHLWLGLSLLEPSEKGQVLHALLRAGTRAERSAAFAIAAQQFERATELVKGLTDLPAETRFDVHSRHVRCVFLSGEVERAAALCEALFELATTRLAQGAAYALKTQILEFRGKLLEAVATIRAGLRLFGVELPEAHADIERGIGEGIGRMQEHLAKTSVSALAELPDMEDPERVMTLNLLFQVIPPAIQTHPPLFVLAELLMFDLGLRHGVTEKSCKNFVDCGIIQGGILGNYDVAYGLGQTAFRLLERYRPTPLESAVHFVFAAFVSQFKRPFREGFESYARAARAGLDLGDVQHLAYATVHRSHRSLLVGRKLADCEQEARDALKFLEGAHAAGQLLGLLVSTWSLARLTGSETMQPAAGRTEEDVVAALLAGGNAQWLYSFGQAQTSVSFLLGDTADAQRWQAFTEPYSPAGISLFSLPDYHLFRALLLLEPTEPRGAEERARALEEVRAEHERLEKWARECPENFAHKQHLLAAELARAEGAATRDVLALYDAAIVAAGGDFIQFAALAYELQARYLSSLGDRRLAILSLQRAYQLYEAWGARAKLQRLAREFPELSSLARSPAARVHQETTTATKQGRSDLDLVSVVKATRAISGEVRPERLFRTLMDAIIENAGAELGCLLLRGEGDAPPVVQAWAAVDQALASPLKAGPLDEAERVCKDIVRYVIRTHECVVLDDAAASGAFAEDPYLQRHAVRSLLCMPVLNQGNLVAVLYAENNAARCAFTKDRIETLSVIAGQAAISITNALLYQNLEQKVEARTRELADKHREMTAMLNGMEQGVFTIDDALRIHPQYSAHLERLLGTSELGGQELMPLLFRGAKLRGDQLAATDMALRIAFGVPQFMAELNLGHAVRSFEVVRDDGKSRFLEVDWNLMVDDQGVVDRILVAVRDMTQLRDLKELASRREREADIVGQILDSGLEKFRQFQQSSEALLQQCRQLVGGAVPLVAGDISTLFRNAHTIKGNARLLGYSHVVDVVHEVEDAYAELRCGQRLGTPMVELGADLERIAQMLSEYARVCEGKLRPLAQSRDSRLERTVREVKALLDAGGADGPAERLRQVERSLARLEAVPFAELVKDTAQMLPSLAAELGKSVPFLELHDDGTAFDQKSAGVIQDVLVHAFRNALDHGIEPPEERSARGKASQGTLRLQLERQEQEIMLRLLDDGRGLAVDQLRRRIGLEDAGDDVIAEAVFGSGVSTASAVSRVSGRGVGMDVVRASMRKLGGEARIVFTAEPAHGYRPFELRLSLPKGVAES